MPKLNGSSNNLCWCFYLFVALQPRSSIHRQSMNAQSWLLIPTAQDIWSTFSRSMFLSSRFSIAPKAELQALSTSCSVTSSSLQNSNGSSSSPASVSTLLYQSNFGGLLPVSSGLQPFSDHPRNLDPAFFIALLRLKLSFCRRQKKILLTILVR